MIEELDKPASEASTGSGMIDRLMASTGFTQKDAMHALLTQQVCVTVKAGAGAVFGQRTLPGHKNGVRPKLGPVKSDVMMILSHPRPLDVVTGSYISEEDGASHELREACKLAGVDPSNWYITAVVKHAFPQNRTDPLREWITDCLPILEQEIRLVDPKYILVAGRHALAALFGNTVKLSNVRGTVLNFLNKKVVPVLSPSAVTQSPSNKLPFQTDMKFAASVIRGTHALSTQVTTVNLLDTQEKLWNWVETASKLRGWWALDTEGDGLRPHKGGLRTIQLCRETGKVDVLHLRNEKMEPVLDDDDAAAALRVVLCDPDVHIIGHNGRFDVQWLRAYGVNCLPQFLAGFDTILAHHALYPTDEQQLEIVCNKLIGPDRYDTPIRLWGDKNPEDKERFGYAHVPDRDLIPYGARDADKTFQLAQILLQELSKPENAPLLRMVLDTALPATAGIIEMEENGLRVDMEQFEKLETLYKAKYKALYEQLLAELDWPDFNPNSPQQRNDLLFGSRFNGQKSEDGTPIQLRPAHVPCMDLTPIKTTGAKPLMWEDVVEEGNESRYSPSSDNETLGMLAAQNPLLGTLRDIRYLGKAIAGFMPDPKVSKLDGSTYYSSGIRGWMWDSGYVKTHISQLAETGRWRSSDPNMQNLPSSRELDFQRIFNDTSFPPLKSIFVGDSDMPILLENDYQLAEVNALARLSNDTAMLHILTDKKRDIHSEMAVRAFKLPWNADRMMSLGVYMKTWMSGQFAKEDGVVTEVVTYPDDLGGHIIVGGKKIDVWPGHKPAVVVGQKVRAKQLLTTTYKARRNAGKTLIFGIPYQRGAKAMAREIKKVGIECDVSQAQELIDAYHESFPDASKFLDFCKASVYSPGYLESPYGRRRFFFKVSSKSAMKAQEREASNWPIQSLVADAVNSAVYNFARAKSKYGNIFRLKLAIHDSIILTCAGKDVPLLVEKVIPECMGSGNIVPKLNFGFGLDTAAFLRWLEAPSEAQLEAAGWPAGYKI